MAENNKPAAAKDLALAQFKQLLKLDGQGISDRFVAEFLTQASNRRLARLAAKGDERARQRILARLEARRIEARFWSYLKKTLSWETSRLLRDIERRNVMEATVLNEPFHDYSYGEDRLSRTADPAETVQAELESAASLEESVANLQLWRALATLTPRQYQIIQLLFVADLAEVQVARALGISQQAVNKAKLAGLRRLKRAIQNSEGGELRN